MAHTFTTILCWTDSDGEEHEACAKVTYEREPGYQGDRINPPEPNSVEITSVVRTDPGEPIDEERWRTDPDLIAEAMEDWTEDAIAAAEWRAQSRRDELMGGF